MAKQNTQILILYGSETGNSEDYAYQIYRSIKPQFENCDLHEADSFNNINIFPEIQILIFVVSTSGQGSEPKNFKMFWKNLLQSRISTTWLSKSKFAVLGLGDSNYKRYNFCAKRLYRRLIQLGAMQALPLGLANDQDPHGTDSVALPWISELLQFITSFFSISIDIYTKYQRYMFDVHPHLCVSDPCLCSHLNINSPKISILENNRVTSVDHFQQVNHITFSIETNMMYSPGDILMVYPKNDRRLVSDMISQFSHIDKIQTVDIKCSSGHQSSVRCVNFEWLCHWYFDLNGVPRRQFFRLLNFYSCNDFEREKLLDFSLPENIEDFYSYCSRPKRNYCETLRDFPNSINNLGLKELVELIPRIKTREYSICSSYRKDSTKLSLIVAFVKYQTVIRQPRHGVCSNYLCHLNFSDQIYAKILKSTLIFPHRDIPCIMIATGTGCASFHAYIQSIMGNSSNPSHLVFLGFRNKEKDFLFKKDWEDFEKSKNIKMFTAFSRDQHQKIYVQDRITENGSLIWEYISKGAWIYLSGNAKRMPDDVYESIKNIVKLFGKLTEKIATKFMSDLEKLNRYQTETY